MKDLWKAVFYVLCGLLGAAIILVASSPPRGGAITLLPPPTPEPIQVHVTGAVVQPGLYSLPAKSRVQDAILAAGGLLPAAYSQTINLAAFVEDGARVLVPYQPTATPQAIVGRAPVTELLTPESSQLININTASQSELESLPQIGPVTAVKIIEYRETHGPFSTIDEIQNVSGIGPKTFEKIKDLITVEVTP
jgi:competence protein ComEA